MKNHERQMNQVRAFTVAPDPRYQVNTFAVEQWGDYVAIVRSYWLAGREHHDGAIGYHECVRVGPRGGAVTVSKRFHS